MQINDQESKEKSDVFVGRRINKANYNNFRRKALKEHGNVGDALNQAMANLLEKQEEKCEVEWDCQDK